MISDAIRLLTGAFTDHEFYRHLEADRFGLFYEVPRRGWSHRLGKLISALVQAASLLVSILLILFIFVATTVNPR